MDGMDRRKEKLEDLMVEKHGLEDELKKCKDPRKHVILQSEIDSLAEQIKRMSSI